MVKIFPIYFSLNNFTKFFSKLLLVKASTNGLKHIKHSVVMPFKAMHVSSISIEMKIA